jgi:hypothetical protein
VSKHVVLCDCEGGPNPRVIAWIDDERPNGPVRIDSNTSFTAAIRVPNRRGGKATFHLRCKGCRKKVTLSDTTVGDIIDKLAPVRDTLEVASIPAIGQLRVPLGKPAPEVIQHEDRYVIPFLMLCRIVTKLGETQ